MGCFSVQGQGQKQAPADPGSTVGNVMKKFMGTCFFAVASGFGWTLGADMANEMVQEAKAELGRK
jgi:hypothetical protein